MPDDTLPDHPKVVGGGHVRRIDAALNAVREHGLTGDAALLMVYVAHRDGGRGCFAGVERMAADLGWAKSRVKRARAALKACPAVEHERAGRSPAVFRFVGSTGEPTSVEPGTVVGSTGEPYVGSTGEPTQQEVNEKEQQQAADAVVAILNECGGGRVSFEHVERVLAEHPECDGRAAASEVRHRAARGDVHSPSGLWRKLLGDFPDEGAKRRREHERTERRLREMEA